MKLDLTKPVETSDGRPARIIATDRKNGHYPIVVLIDLGKYEVVESFNYEGLSPLSQRRLVNTAKREKLFVNVFAAADDESFFFTQYSSEESAASFGGNAGLWKSDNLLSRAELTIENGEIVSVRTLWKKSEEK